MRTDLVPKDELQNETLQRSVLIEAEYFRLHSLINKLDIFMYGTLLDSALKIKLNEFYGKQNQRWELIYKASRDGFDANAFHTRCNNQGPTMTIVLSNNNYLFEGYASVPWTSSRSYGNDTTAFLFTLTNPHNIPPTKYFINPGNVANAVFHHSSYGPYFGSGALSLTNNSNSSKSNIGFPNVYIDTTRKGNTTFTGANTFITSDIEVFKLA